jgi:hypothetical protein
MPDVWTINYFAIINIQLINSQKWKTQLLNLVDNIYKAEYLNFGEIEYKTLSHKKS